MRHAKRHRKPRLSLVKGMWSQKDFYTFQHLPSRYRYSSEMSACEICGDSLKQAGILEGYMAAILNGGAVKSGDLVAAEACDEPDGYKLVRFAFFGPGGRVRLQAADRDEYPDLIYRSDQLQIIGPVVHAEPRAVRLSALPED